MARWTPEEIAAVNRARNLAEAQERLAHRTPGAVYMRWRSVHGTGRTRGIVPRIPAPLLPFRPRMPLNRPLTADETRVAQIFSAIYRITHREHIAVDVWALLDALRDGYWRELRDIEWAAAQVIGRDVQ